MRGLAASVILVTTACTTGGASGPPLPAAATPTEVATSTEPEIGTPIEAPGIEERVVLVAPPVEGAAEIPFFEWEPVEGAAAYLLVVQGPSGDAMWAWRGQGARVALGGAEGRPVGEAGPLLEAGSSWSVAALDGDGHVMAVSLLRPVSP